VGVFLRRVHIRNAVEVYSLRVSLFRRAAVRAR
jgi:hypothetical protein